MARKGRKHSGLKRGVISFVCILLIALIIYFAYPYLNEMFGETPPEHKVIPVGDGEYIEVHIIDVGQGDSILIRTSGGNMLIDAGPGSAEDELKDYLTELEITDIEYAVFTHPDEDHIGGADMIMTDFTVSNVIMPDKDPGTKTYLRLTQAIEASKTANNTALMLPDPGAEYTLGAMTATVLAPLSEKYSDTNDYSVVMRLDFGDTSFMMTGDAENKSEKEMVAKYGTDILDCDVLKVGHHGSDTSTTPEFLASVSPQIALISCGVGNTYGHPCAVTLQKLLDAGAVIYRTDELGSIIVVSDGKTVSVSDAKNGITKN